MNRRTFLILTGATAAAAMKQVQARTPETVQGTFPSPPDIPPTHFFEDFCKHPAASPRTAAIIYHSL